MRHSHSFISKMRGCGCGVFMLIPLLVFTVMWCLWYFYPMSEEEQLATDITVVSETRYVISGPKGKELLAFTSTRGDTLLHGVSGVEREVLHGQWVRRYQLLPYSGGSIAVESFDTLGICRFPTEDILSLLKHEAEYLVEEQEVARRQRKDIDYFLRTHTVIDDGFDIVARYSDIHNQTVDSISKVQKLLAEAIASGKKGKLTITLDRHYYISSARGRIECVPTIARDSVLLLRIRKNEQQSDMKIEQGFSTFFSHSRMSAKMAYERLKARKPKTDKKKTSAIDTLGVYSGVRDSLAMPHGYGHFTALNGDYYEGEWEHGKRTGVGFSLLRGKRLMLGEWKDDKFLGERIAYTPERIYGIDISRYQHEKGRKRFSINWKDLRITSLGRLSKKTIHGTVNYPVRFIFIKATEGVTVRNKYFASDYANARKYGYKTGAYHFFSVRTPGRNQAINFLRNSRYNKGDLPPVLDLEPTDAQIRQAGGVQALFRNVRTWLNAVEKQRGVRPILYISQRFVNKYLPQAPDLQKNYDVWIARYGEYRPDVNLVYWQLSPDGRVSGIKTEVDINVYNGFNF